MSAASEEFGRQEPDAKNNHAEVLRVVRAAQEKGFSQNTPAPVTNDLPNFISRGALGLARRVRGFVEVTEHASPEEAQNPPDPTQQDPIPDPKARVFRTLNDAKEELARKEAELRMPLGDPAAPPEMAQPVADPAPPPAPTAETQAQDDPAPTAQIAPTEPEPTPQSDTTPEIDIEAIKQAAYAEGFSDGLNQKQEAQPEEDTHDDVAQKIAQLTEARKIFEEAAQKLTEPSLGDIYKLRQSIAQAVMEIAGQRAGSQIDHLPDGYLHRVEHLTDRVAQGMRDVLIKLNPDDLAALKPHLAGSDLVTLHKLQEDPRLARGDIEVRAGTIKLRDILNPSA